MQAAQEVKPEGQSSLDLSFNLGAAYGAIAQVLKNMDTRNSAQQVRSFRMCSCTALYLLPRSRFEQLCCC